MRQLVFMQPNRARDGFTHFLPVGTRDERGGDPIKLGRIDAAAQLNPVNNIAPLV